MKNKFNIAVLIGKGGRLRSIYNCVKKIPNAEIVLVVSDKINSAGIDWAKKQKVEAFCLPLKKWLSDNPDKNRKDYNLKLVALLKNKKVNFVVLAGWDVILYKEFLENFPNQVINIHPSLCPAFGGMEAEKQALEYGVKYTGCTLHFVDEGVDTGPIILQEVVKIEDGDTLKTLQKKIHKKEEKILKEGIKAICKNRLILKGRRVIIKNRKI